MWSDTETSIPNFSKVIILPYENMRSDTVEYSELITEKDCYELHKRTELIKKWKESTFCKDAIQKKSSIKSILFSTTLTRKRS